MFHQKRRVHRFVLVWKQRRSFSLGVTFFMELGVCSAKVVCIDFVVLFIAVQLSWSRSRDFFAKISFRNGFVSFLFVNCVGMHISVIPLNVRNKYIIAFDIFLSEVKCFQLALSFSGTRCRLL